MYYNLVIKVGGGNSGRKGRFCSAEERPSPENAAYQCYKITRAVSGQYPFLLYLCPHVQSFS